MDKILFYLGHPAHFHLFKNAIRRAQSKGNKVLVVCKKKDILQALLDSENMEYENILSEGKGEGKLDLVWSMAKRDYRFWKRAQKFKPDIMLGTSAEIAHIGKLLRIPSYVFEEDDWDVIPTFARMVYPFATKLVAPIGCRMGRWDDKTIRHNSYHELAYLHPDHFKPDKEKVRTFHKSGEPYFILRFVELTAHHDEGISGISDEKAIELIKILERHGKIYITSERVLDGELEKYRININPLHIHHALHFAKMYIGDSQTMAAESMVLGTPAIRYNDFVGRISYLEELENNYQLGFGIKTKNFERLIMTVLDLLSKNNLEKEWRERKNVMLDNKVNLTSFIFDNIININMNKN